MISNASRRRQGLAALGCALAVAATVGAGANGQKFYPDDPITRIVDAADASGVQEREIDLAYDTLENLFSWPGDQTPNVRAQNLNTIDEVPDSTWFTNRLGTVPVTVDELVKGPGSGIGPAPGGWTVISAKNDGVMPGFTVRDSAGQVWFVKFDPPGYPAMATGTEVLVARLFWGLGYHVPETHLATLRPERIDDRRAGPHHDAQWQAASHQGVGYPAPAAQSAPRVRWIVPGRRQQGARGAAPRRVPLLRHPVGRSQRCDPPRASSRAAGLRDLLRLAEPRRLEINQHARHRRRAGRAAGRPPSPAGFRLDDRERGRLPARGVRRMGIPRGGQEDAGRHGEPRALRQELADDPAVSGTTPWAPSRSTTRSGIPSGGNPATPIPRSDRRAWTTSSGPRGGSRHSPTRC